MSPSLLSQKLRAELQEKEKVHQQLAAQVKDLANKLEQNTTALQAARRCALNPAAAPSPSPKTEVPVAGTADDSQVPVIDKPPKICTTPPMENDQGAQKNLRQVVIALEIPFERQGSQIKFYPAWENSPAQSECDCTSDFEDRICEPGPVSPAPLKKIPVARVNMNRVVPIAGQWAARFSEVQAPAERPALVAPPSWFCSGQLECGFGHPTARCATGTTAITDGN